MKNKKNKSIRTKNNILDKFKVKSLVNFVYNFSSKENVEKLDKTWIDNIWNIIAIPERSMEIEAWISKNPTKVLMLNGKHGESMIHWGVLSSISLTMALYNCGIDINAKDSDGKTPFDWLMERYNIIFISKEQKVNKDGENRIKAETQSVGSYIWNIGARPSSSIKEIKNGEDLKMLTNIANGEMWIIKLLYSTYGKDILKGWLEDKRSLIHIWSLCPKSKIKKQGFETLMSHLKLTENTINNKEDIKILDIDEKDINERTALWYTLDAIFLEEISLDIVENLRDNIEILLSLGADIYKKDIFNVSPYDILLKNKDHKLFDFLNTMFENNLKK